MNLDKLFAAQKELGKIGLFAYKGDDRFEKLVLALLVELGECANEWRGFKFWSKDQEPRSKAKRLIFGGYGLQEEFNPLLEEYVDGLHFILELGIEKDLKPEELNISKEKRVTDAFLSIMEVATFFELSPGIRTYSLLFERFIELGVLLGFTWEQVEAAYFEKHAINIKRQREGY